jgi:hypothetical protein
MPVKIQGDGNCLFHSLSYGVNETVFKTRPIPMDHVQLRSIICNFIENKPSKFSSWISIDHPKYTVEKYVKKMRTLGKWGGIPEIIATSLLCDLKIYVWAEYQGKKGSQYKCQFYTNPQTDFFKLYKRGDIQEPSHIDLNEPAIHILFNSNHYSFLQPKSF